MNSEAFKSPDFVVKIINKFWTPGKKILDIGCGPAFLRDVFGDDYLGVDNTLLPYRADLPRKVDFVCSAENIGLSSNCVDIVFIKSAFFLFKNHEQTLKEVYRILKPQGRLFIFDYNKKTQKILQNKERHNHYPCWTQWGLKKLIKLNGFMEVKNFLAQEFQFKGIANFLRLVIQELYGDWVIVSGIKKAEK